MRNIICFRYGDYYGPEYIKVLKKQLKNYNVIVLGDGEDADIKESPMYQMEGFWYEMRIFAPDLKKYQPFLYLDIDSFIMDEIDEVFDKKERLIPLEWNPGARNKYIFTLAWLTYTDDIWEEWYSDRQLWMDTYHTSQDFISRFNFNSFQEEMPGFVGSYKRHNRLEPVNKIIAFHGVPKMPQAKGWAQDRWLRYVKD